MDSLFGLDKTHVDNEDLKLLTTVYDNGSLSVVRSLLDSEKIPYMLKERGSGSSMKIIAGFSVFGTDIYVPDKCFNDALDIIKVPDDADEGISYDDNTGMDMDSDYADEKDDKDLDGGQINC